LHGLKIKADPNNIIKNSNKNRKFHFLVLTDHKGSLENAARGLSSSSCNPLKDETIGRVDENLSQLNMDVRPDTGTADSSNNEKNKISNLKSSYTLALAKDSLTHLCCDKNLEASPPNKLFIEWLVGFSDAESNFNISLRNFKDNKYNSLILTYQIGLHIDDLQVLNFIKTNLGCGKISISGNRCNFFVNDRYSLINTIVPIFKNTKLKSSKYYQFLIFEKAVNLIKNKSHLTPNGKLEIINLYNASLCPLGLKEKEMNNLNILTMDQAALIKAGFNQTFEIVINKYWLGGFVDGDASFSVSVNNPRLKFENHIKELPLFKSIAKYFNILAKGYEMSNSLNITKPLLAYRQPKNRNNSNSTVSLDYTNIHFLKKVIVPLFTVQRCVASPKVSSQSATDSAINVTVLKQCTAALPLDAGVGDKKNKFKLLNSKKELDFKD
jgi:hypothetical protein